MTVAPEGSHWEKNANAGGSSGDETAPPEDALTSTTTNSHVGRIALARTWKTVRNPTIVATSIR